MFRKAVYALLLAASLNAFALDEVSAIPQNHQTVLKAVTDELGLKNVDKSTQKKIYDMFEYALKDGWYSYWVGNGDLVKSKFKDDKVRIVDLIVPNDNRTNSVTFTYFPAVKQIYVARRQFVEGSSTDIMDLFGKAKDNSKLKKLHESDKFAFFQKDGFVEFELYHVTAPHAAAAYIDYGIVDVN